MPVILALICTCFVTPAGRLNKIAEAYDLAHLPQQKKFNRLAEVALPEIASIDKQLIRNIAAKHDEDVWKLHDKEVYSVAMRVCSHNL